MSKRIHSCNISTECAYRKSLKWYKFNVENPLLMNLFIALIDILLALTQGTYLNKRTEITIILQNSKHIQSRISSFDRQCLS